MIEGKTSTGFEFKINENALKDWEYVTRIGKAQKLAEKGDEKLFEIFSEFDWALSFLIGEEKDKLFDHIRKANDGYLPTDKVIAEWKEIAGARGIKNSGSSQK